MDVEAALERWSKEVVEIQQGEFSLANWSSDEVRILSSGVARFSDDFHNICPFLPGKTQKSIANIYYTFLSMFDGKDSDSIIRLFHLSETHRPQLRHALLGNSNAGPYSGVGGAYDAHDDGPLRKSSSGGSSGGSKKRARQDSKSGQPGKSGKSGGKHARGQQGSSSQPHSSQQGGGGSVSSNTLEYGGYDNLSSEVEHDLDVGDDEGRVQASQRFLATAKEVMPGETYASLVDLLVEFDSEHITMTRLISEIMGLLQPYPKLEAGFYPFLPPTW